MADPLCPDSLLDALCALCPRSLLVALDANTPGDEASVQEKLASNLQFATYATVLLVHTFERVMGKSHAIVSSLYNECGLVHDETYFANIKSNILPHLRHGITSLSLSFNTHANTLEYPGKNFAPLPGILNKIEDTLDQYQFPKLDDNCQNMSKHQAPWDNQYLLTFKNRHVVFSLTEILLKMLPLLNASRDLIIAVNLPGSQWFNVSYEVFAPKREEIKQLTAFSRQLIDKLDEKLNRSYCSFYQDEFQEEATLTEKRALKEVLKFLNFQLGSVFTYQYDGMTFEYLKYPPPTERIRELGKLAVPIIKLTRLFLNKLSRASEDIMTILSRMSSSDLFSLLQICRSISNWVSRVSGLISDLDTWDSEAEELVSQQDYFDAFKLGIETISGLFESASLVLLPHLESLSADRFDYKIHPKTWLKVWNDQFLLATQAFKDACVPPKQN